MIDYLKYECQNDSVTLNIDDFLLLNNYITN